MGEATLVRLMTLMSPAFPVGTFSYSHGLETAIEDGLVRDRAGLVGWLADLVAMGSAWNDAVLLSEAWRRATAGGSVDRLARLGEAMAGSAERHLETMAQGSAFAAAVAAWHGGAGPDAASDSGGAEADVGEASWPYPVAVGATAASHGIAIEAALQAYLHGFVSGLTQAAVRLVPLGQRDGVRAMAELEPAILAVARRAAHATLDDLGSATVISDLCAMRHEMQTTRLFRS